MRIVFFIRPLVLLLCLVQKIVVVRLHQRGHDHPFRDLRSVYAVRCGQGNISVRVDGMAGYMIDSCREKMHEPEIWGVRHALGQDVEGGENGDAFEEIWGKRTSIQPSAFGSWRSGRDIWKSLWYTPLGRGRFGLRSIW